MKLSPIQQRALAKLSESEGQCAHDLGESLGTLNSLCLKKLAFAHRSGLGTLYSPRTGIMFFRKPANDE
jgi:hypothetical protein